MHSENVNVKLDGYQTSNDRTYFIDAYVSSGSITTAPIKIARKLGYSASLSCPSTGSPVGSFAVQYCNDLERVLDIADGNLVNWVDVTGGSSAVSGASLICIEDNRVDARWARFVYTRTSGSITATIRMHVKQESAQAR